ncbi:MAG: GLPGLI family protein [Bacteroidia bacterium]
MKNFLAATFLFFLASNFYTQNIKFIPNIRVTYDAQLQLGQHFKKSQQFVLVGNSNNYYFGGAQNYLNDTKQYEAKGVDVQSISDYFQERVIKTNKNFNVLYAFSDVKIRYIEEDHTKWVLYGDMKTINGIKCQLAATNKFGRRWIAYFTKDYGQQIGPYKFSGLPGLILELYDTKKDYHFLVSKIEKYSHPFAFSVSPYRNFSKKDYMKAKYNLEFEGAGFPPMYGNMKKDFNEMSSRLKKMYDNPLESDPFQ